MANAASDSPSAAQAFAFPTTASSAPESAIPRSQADRATAVGSGPVCKGPELCNRVPASMFDCCAALTSESARAALQSLRNSAPKNSLRQPFLLELSDRLCSTRNEILLPAAHRFHSPLFSASGRSAPMHDTPHHVRDECLRAAVSSEYRSEPGYHESHATAITNWTGDSTSTLLYSLG